MFDIEKLKDNNAIFWTFMFPEIRKTAANLGWAIGIHGSVVHDLDLMAMPWVENHCPADMLAEQLALVCNHWKDGKYTKHENEKPCNRVVYTIPAGASYIDLNVIKEVDGETILKEMRQTILGQCKEWMKDEFYNCPIWNEPRSRSYFTVQDLIEHLEANMDKLWEGGQDAK